MKFCSLANCAACSSQGPFQFFFAATKKAVQVGQSESLKLDTIIDSTVTELHTTNLLVRASLFPYHIYRITKCCVFTGALFHVSPYDGLRTAVVSPPRVLSLQITTASSKSSAMQHKMN
jgi:hypothetical protein